MGGNADVAFSSLLYDTAKHGAMDHREEHSMDRDYYYRTEAVAHQAAVDKELATRHLLREDRLPSMRARKEVPNLVRVAPVSIMQRILRLLRLAI